MNEINSMKVIFPSLSANEGFARGAVAVFVSQLDPTVSEQRYLRQSQTA